MVTGMVVSYLLVVPIVAPLRFLLLDGLSFIFRTNGGRNGRMKTSYFIIIKMYYSYSKQLLKIRSVAVSYMICIIAMCKYYKVGLG